MISVTFYGEYLIMPEPKQEKYSNSNQMIETKPKQYLNSNTN